MAVRLTFTNLNEDSANITVSEENAYIIAQRIAELTESLTWEEVLESLNATVVNVNVNRYHND